MAPAFVILCTTLPSEGVVLTWGGAALRTLFQNFL